MNSVTDLMTLSNYTPITRTFYLSDFIVEVPENKNVFHKLGKLAGKTVRFFRRSETKAAAMLTYWAVETFLFAVIMISATSSFVFFSALFLYLYGSYALFSAINVLTK